MSKKADHLIALMYESALYHDPNEGRSHISGLEHSLRVASLAKRTLGTRKELIFAALVHDIARPLSDIYHGEVIAEIVRDTVSDNIYQVLRTHGEFQDAVVHNRAFPYLTEKWYGDALNLCAWEVGSFTKKWTVTTITTGFASELIRDVCTGR